MLCLIKENLILTSASHSIYSNIEYHVAPGKFQCILGKKCEPKKQTMS